MPWITTSTGKHINTDWFDEKDRQIQANKAEADNRNFKYFKGKKVTEEEFNRLVAGNKLESLKESVKTSESLIPKNSYTDNPEYKEASKWLRENGSKERDVKEKWLAAYKEYDKLRDKYVDPELVRELGRNQARELVWDSDHPDVAEMSKKVDQLGQERKQIEKDVEAYRDKLDRMDREASRKQQEEYGRPEFKEAHGDYPGFKTNESTTTNIDRALKEGRAKVVEMTPEQYIHECAHYIFHNSTLEKTLRSRVGNKDTEKYAKMMREGTKFDTPYLDYSGEGQEGLHRAVAAYMNDLEKIPVIIVGKRR